MAHVRLITLAACLLAAACGSKDGDDEAGYAGPVMEGVWKSGCADSSIATLTFKGTLSTLDVASYGEAACSTLLAKFSAVRTFEFVGAVDGLTNAHKVNYTYQSLGATLVDEDTVLDFNTKKYFGYDNWQINVPKDVAGKKASVDDADSDAQPAVGFISYVILKAEDSNLTPGDLATGDGKTDAKRPKTLETTTGNVLTKQ